MFSILINQHAKIIKAKTIQNILNHLILNASSFLSFIVATNLTSSQITFIKTNPNKSTMARSL